MAALLRAVVAASVLSVIAAPLETTAQPPTGDEAAARKERRERYARLAEAGDQGDFATACAGFAQLDVEEPNETFLVAALKACLLASDLERAAELTRRASRSTPGPDLEGALREATTVLDREGGFIVVRCKSPCRPTLRGRPIEVDTPFWVARGAVRVGFEVGGEASTREIDVRPATTIDVEPPAPPAPPPPPGPARPSRGSPPLEQPASPDSDSALSPAFFFVGLGLSAALAVGTVASALDTKDRHDQYLAKGVGADEGEAAQLRTNALFFTTLGVGLGTGAIGIFATRWSDTGTPDGAVARVTLAR